MSSPSKQRSALTPKHSNIGTPSPKKHRIENPFFSDVKIPYSQPGRPTSVSPKRPRLNFTIYEDRRTNHDQQSTQGRDSTEDIHDNQENILQPKKIETRGVKRVPLSNLSLKEFPGYVQFDHQPVEQLTELYQPINFNNDFNSLHKFSNLPNYLTPPRDWKNKYLAKSSVTDDVEMNLIKKSSILKHRRSLSLGKNDSKSRLITKNKFNILST